SRSLEPLARKPRTSPVLTEPEGWPMMALSTAGSGGAPMRRSGLVLALFLIASTAAFTARASEENAATFTQALVSHLALAPEPCREKNEGAGAGSVFVCAHATSDFETFRNVFDGLMENADKLPFLPTSLTDWQTQVGGRIRWYALGDKWI